MSCWRPDEPRIETIGDATLYLGTAGTFCRRSGRWTRLLPIRLMALGLPRSRPLPARKRNECAQWDNSRPQATIETLLALGRCIIWGGNYFDLPPGRGWLIWTKTGNAPSMADLEMAWTTAWT